MKTYAWIIRKLLPKKVRRKDEIRRNEVVQLRAKAILRRESRKAWEAGILAEPWTQNAELSDRRD